MKASRNIQKKWYSMVILIAFAAVMLAASIAPVLASATYIPPDPENLANTTDNYLANYTVRTGNATEVIKSNTDAGVTSEVFKFIAYYGWINCSGINWADPGLTLVIIADDNQGEIQQVRGAGVEVYFYIALGSTYKISSDKDGWEHSIKNSIDSHDYVDGFFWDEIDPGYYGQDNKDDFNQRLTAINSYVHSKDQKTIANGVRYYADHCGSDYYMWESFMSSFTGSVESPDYHYVDFFDTTGSNSDSYQWINNIDKWKYLQNRYVLNKTLVHCYGDPLDDNKSNYGYIAARVLRVKGFSYVNNRNFASTAVTLAKGMRWDLGTQFDYTVDESNETLSGQFANGNVEDDVGKTVSTGNAFYFLFDETIAPASITGLNSITYEQTCINWTWTDPADTDFEKVMIYLDGAFETNVSKCDKHYNATGLSPETNYMISTHTADTSGNVNETWVNDTARTEPSPDTTPTPPSDGSNSRGGGGGGMSDEPGNVEETVFLRIYLRAGDSATYNFNNTLTSVEVTPEKTYGLVGAKVEVLADRPGSITTDPPNGVLYKYFNVFVGNLGWSEGKFSSSVINFQVPASLFGENNIGPATVTLYRHHDGEWQPLKTTMTGQAGGNYQYSSPTPGFSTFMILGQVEESGTVEPVATTDSGIVANSTPTPEATSTSTKGTPGFGILVGIIGILIAVYSVRK
ncbi:MAG: PGF-pre-PGF domain-containing protein [ANME-2 cluster archaeon]|nr:PGF-pre-PGF domain-containing protein [ANME-2 cluster archaeon]MBC2700587.1 PGF-pre-PGF domain-containing protein [ANME-2 cluster archaeon]MBC2708730.1 PGF-pre-PGF domain-containing protein [ANME-2 cluster archaeon]MBC2747972.1 PGF-pre-PGF domain-containing protein [ANME-2 cluster archaeon]MBC2764135.1 PGF-pre-PGF domain-containing protein [ANME-2 cluster archaeon]